VRPALSLPGEDEPIAVGPEDLGVGRRLAEDAAGAGRRAKDEPTLSGGRVRDADRPGRSLPLRAEDLPLLHGGDPHERHAPRVRRPRGLAVAVDARVEVDERVARRVPDADVGMVAAVADERETRAVGRPAQVADLAAGVERLRRLRVRREPDEPCLVLRDVGDAAVRRRRRTVTLRQAARRSARHGRDPDLLEAALGRGEGIRELALAVAALPAREDDACAVGREREVGDVEAVVVGEPRQRPSRPAGRLGDPDVARAAVVVSPGDPRGARRSLRRGRPVRVGSRP
jgi:hypothetical protein